MKRTRQNYTDAQKRRAVRDVLGGATRVEAARKIGCHGSVVTGWLNNPKFQPKANGKSAGNGLPVKAAKSSRARTPKIPPNLIPRTGECPHCGGEVRV